MAPSPVAVLRAVVHRAVLPVRRRVRPFLVQSEGPSDPLLDQLLGLFAGLLGFVVYAAVALVGAALAVGYALVYPVLRCGEVAVDALRRRVDTARARVERMRARLGRLRG